MRKFSITVFLELKDGRREGKDDFPPFLCSPTPRLNFQVTISLMTHVYIKVHKGMAFLS